MQDLAKRDPRALKAMGVDQSELVKGMPEFQTQVKLYNRHLDLAQAQCTAGHLQAKRGELLKIIEDVEQTLATGFDRVAKPAARPVGDPTAACAPFPGRHAYVSKIAYRSNAASQTFMIA